jgi:hypothetical protein
MVHCGSKYGIEEFLEVKYLCMDGIDQSLNIGARAKRYPARTPPI